MILQGIRALYLRMVCNGESLGVSWPHSSPSERVAFKVRYLFGTLDLLGFQTRHLRRFFLTIYIKRPLHFRTLLFEDFRSPETLVGIQRQFLRLHRQPYKVCNHVMVLNLNAQVSRLITRT